MLLLTNCTFDGVVYNPRRVMEEVLAIKPDICFLWDEAWYAFATAVPWARQRTAMVVRRATRVDAVVSGIRCRNTGSGARRCRGSTASEWVERRLLPDPGRARVRVYATHSTHKSLSALRQASMIHVRDQDFKALTRDAFGEAFLTHTSTSPEPAAARVAGSGASAGRHRGVPNGPPRLRHGAGLPSPRPQRPADQQVVPHPRRIRPGARRIPALRGQLLPSGAPRRVGGVERGVAVRPIRARRDAGHPVSSARPA